MYLWHYCKALVVKAFKGLAKILYKNIWSEWGPGKVELIMALKKNLMNTNIDTHYPTSANFFL